MFGADRDEVSANTNSFAARADATTNGVFAQVLAEPVPNLNFTAGIRRDDHSQFGIFDTFRLTGAYYIPLSGTKFRASYGTAFRAPSLYELFEPTFGNAALTPEESNGWDAGIDQSFADGKYSASATYFSLNTENLIGFVANYQNVTGTTERHGVELSAKAHFAPWLTTTASYTYTDTKRADGSRLIRVPRHIVALGIDMKPAEKLTVSATANIVRDTLGVSPTFTQDYILDDYVLLNAKATYAVSESLSIYVRGVNLLNDEYQTVRGYGTSDRAFYAGLNLKLQAPPTLDASTE
jgi:vitamin B12 transporter